MKIDKKTIVMIREMSIPQLQKFLENFYKQAFQDGANADVDPNIKYLAIKKGVKYECGCCGAELFLGEEDGENEAE